MKKMFTILGITAFQVTIPSGEGEQKPSINKSSFQQRLKSNEVLDNLYDQIRSQLSLHLSGEKKYKMFEKNGDYFIRYETNSVWSKERIYGAILIQTDLIPKSNQKIVKKLKNNVLSVQQNGVRKKYLMKNFYTQSHWNPIQNISIIPQNVRNQVEKQVQRQRFKDLI